ncbi:MAG TPA: histidine phosphatase family protein [Anaerolineales bacterium]|nr:histidine phosphatase family protein [Anaerolineales bacterium]
MTKYLILIRHSLPRIEEDRPANAWNLSVEGQLRAHRLAEQLERFEPEIIVSSNEPKAKETAEILATHFQIDMQTISDLREQDRSNVPYLSTNEFQASMREFFQKPDELVLGSETANQAHTRFYRAVHSILKEHRNKTVLIVTHGTVISLFVSRLTGSSDLELWRQLGLPSFIALDLHSSTLIIGETIL